MTLGSCDLFGPPAPSFSADPITGAGSDLASPWTFASGYVYGGGTSGQYTVELYGVAPAGGLKPWEFGAYSGSNPIIMFSAPSSADPAKLQLELFGDTSKNQTVTFYDGAMNWIITEGWLLFTVDQTAGTAVVKLDVKSANLSFNGTASVSVKP